MFCTGELFILELLVPRCYNCPQKEDRRGGGGWGGDQVLWKPSGQVQVAELVTVPGGSLGGKLVFLKHSGMGVHVAGQVTIPIGSLSGDQVL